MTTASHTTTATTTTLDPEGPEALARAERAAAAIPDADVLPIRLDVSAAASGAMGQMPAIEAKRAEIIAVFGAEGAEAIDAIVPAARNVLLANARFHGVADRDLEPAAASLRVWRGRLHDIVAANVGRGIADRSVLDGQQGGGSYQALGDDTLALAIWLRDHASAIGAHCKLGDDELAAAQAEAEAFVRAVQEKARAGAAPAAAHRARALTYLLHSWDQLRKLVTYTRWEEGDYDALAPSLYAGRRRSSGETSDLLPPSGAVTVPSPTVLPTSTPIPPGMPGAAPFSPQS